MRSSMLAVMLPAVTALTLIATPAVAETKIATIRVMELQRDAPQIKSANEKMKAEFEKKQKDLESEGRKLEDDFKKFQREGDTLSTEQRAKTQKDLSTRKIDFESKQRTIGEQAQTRQRELMRDLESKFAAAIREVAKEKGIGLVVQDPVFAEDGMDITADVLLKLGTVEEPKDKSKKKK